VHGRHDYLFVKKNFPGGAFFKIAGFHFQVGLVDFPVWLCTSNDGLGLGFGKKGDKAKQNKRVRFMHVARGLINRI
jgi:hypothetical protein